MADLIRRVLEYNDYAVEQIMNITDVGHMAEDDSLTITPGEDKVLAAAAAEKRLRRRSPPFTPPISSRRWRR